MEPKKAQAPGGTARLGRIPPGRFDPTATSKMERILDAVAQGKDPTGAEVAAVFPAMRYHSTIVGVNHHPLRIHVGWDGLVSCPGTVQVQMTAGDPPRSWRELEGGLGRSLLDGYLPIVETTLEHDGLRYVQTVVGYSRGLSPAQPLIALVRIKVANDSARERSGTAGLLFERGLTAQELRKGAPHSPARDLARDGAFLRDTDGKAVAWFDTGAQARARWEDGRLGFAFSVAPRGEVSVELRLSRTPLEPGAEAELAEPRFDDAVERSRRAWRDVLGSAMSISVPDPLLADAWKTLAIYGQLLSGQVDSRLEPHDAGGFYEHFYGHAAAAYLHTLAFRGDFEEAKRVALTFLELQRPNGMLSGELEVAHQNGSMLLELCRLFRMSGDRDWFASIVPKVRSACEWIIRERSAGKVVGADGEKPLTYGLLPEHQYCVDQVARFTRAQDYLADTLNWAGLNESALAFRLMGMEEQANRLALEADAYRKDILRSMSRASFPQASPPFLPLVPGLETPYGTLTEAREGAYYCLLAPRMLESGIFPLHDDRSAWVRRYMEERGGLVLGVSVFTESHGIDAHFVYGCALENLRNDDVPRFLLTFRTFMLYGMSRETYSPPECYLIQHGWGGYMGDGGKMEWPAMPQPHLHSLAQTLRIARMMLVQEDGEILHLARGIPREWLADGKRVAVERAQTLFGPVSYRIRSEAARGKIVAEIDFSPRSAPSSIRLHLRHPSLSRIEAVEIDGESWSAVQAEVIALRPAKGRVTVVVRYAESA